MMEDAQEGNSQSHTDGAEPTSDAMSATMEDAQEGYSQSQTDGMDLLVGMVGDSSASGVSEGDASSSSAAPMSADESAESASLPEPSASGPKPKKRTAYFIFADEQRGEARRLALEEAAAAASAADPSSQQQPPPKVGVSDVAKVIGRLWSLLSPDGRKPYEEQSAVEKAAYNAWVVSAGADGDAGGDDDGNDAIRGAFDFGDVLNPVFPITRVRKIAKLDPDVKNLSKEAQFAVSKATELFVRQLASEACAIASVQNRRKLVAGDIADACAVRERLGWLREDMADLVRMQAAAAQVAGAPLLAKKQALQEESKNQLAASNLKISDFFSTGR